MAIVNPNYDELPQIQPGVHRLRIKGCEHKHAKNGNPYLNWKFQIEGGPNAGATVFHMTGLTGKGAQALKALVRAAFDAKYESGPIDTDHLVGFPFQGRLERELNPDGTEGKYMKVMEVFPPADSKQAENYPDWESA